MEINKDLIQDVYSTEEVRTNKVFVDSNGKKHIIYRKKVIIPNNMLPLKDIPVTYDLADYIDNLSEIFIDDTYSYFELDGYELHSPLYYTNCFSGEATQWQRVGATTIVVFSNMNTQERFSRLVLTVEYTKTELS